MSGPPGRHLGPGGAWLGTKPLVPWAPRGARSRHARLPHGFSLSPLSPATAPQQEADTEVNAETGSKPSQGGSSSSQPAASDTTSASKEKETSAEKSKDSGSVRTPSPRALASDSPCVSRTLTPVCSTPRVPCCLGFVWSSQTTGRRGSLTQGCPHQRARGPVDVPEAEAELACAGPGSRAQGPSLTVRAVHPVGLPAMGRFAPVAARSPGAVASSGAASEASHDLDAVAPRGCRRRSGPCRFHPLVSCGAVRETSIVCQGSWGHPGHLLCL